MDSVCVSNGRGETTNNENETKKRENETRRAHTILSLQDLLGLDAEGIGPACSGGGSGDRRRRDGEGGSERRRCERDDLRASGKRRGGKSASALESGSLEPRDL